MFWPRFVLAPQEEKAGATKYYDYPTGRRGVLRKIYPGQLITNGQQRQPVFSFQIARRCRVFGITASGDIGQFRIQLQDSSGEQYIANPCPLATLLGGYVELPPPPYGSSSLGMTGGYPVNTDDAANTLGWANLIGNPRTANPLIFEPNIVLSQNQVLQVVGFPMTDFADIIYRVDLAFHVWEFPSYNMGPT